jgi:hypothetical protein
VAVSQPIPAIPPMPRTGRDPSIVPYFQPGSVAPQVLRQYVSLSLFSLSLYNPCVCAVRACVRACVRA